MNYTVKNSSKFKPSEIIKDELSRVVLRGDY